MEVSIKLEELNDRINNIKLAIEILKQELLILLEEKKAILEHKQI